jgi:hypothetical protein
MCLVNNVLINFLEIFVLVFIDDILIYSKSREEHEEHIKLVLQVLRENYFYANFSKCDFFQKKVHFFVRYQVYYNSQKNKYRRE